MNMTTKMNEDRIALGDMPRRTQAQRQAYHSVRLMRENESLLAEVERLNARVNGLEKALEQLDVEASDQARAALQTTSPHPPQAPV